MTENVCETTEKAIPKPVDFREREEYPRLMAEAKPNEKCLAASTKYILLSLRKSKAYDG